MKRSAIPYSAAELDWIEANKTQPRRNLLSNFCAKFSRKDISLGNLTALCKRNGWKTGRTGHFPKGNISHNKGMKMPFNPNRAKTQFKKGQMPHNTKYLGHEHVTVDGYIEISVAEKNPHTGADRRHVHKHRYLWVKMYGPIPEGMCLKCLDGDKANTDPSNWELISRSLLPRLNNRWGRNYEGAAPENKPAILATAKLEQRVKDIRSAK